MKREFRIEYVPYPISFSSYRVGEIVNDHFVWGEKTFYSIDEAIEYIDKNYPDSLISIS